MVNTRASDVNDDSQFNLSTGTITTEGSNNSLTTITPYPNDWYRISVTATHNNLSGYFWVRIYNQPEGDGFMLWGGQVESGGFPSHCTLNERKPTKWARMTPPPLKVVVSVNTTVNQLLPPLPAIATLPNQTRQIPGVYHSDGFKALKRTFHAHPPICARAHRSHLPRTKGVKFGVKTTL